MSETLTYTLSIGTCDNPNAEEVEDQLQQLLLELYDQGDVESIRVTKDGYSNQDISADGLLDLVDDVTSEHIRQSIDLVKRLEDLDVDDEQ